MSESLFIQQDENIYLPTDNAIGPWNPGLLHGGATAGLIAFVLEKHEAEDNKQYARITLDLFRPVPKLPLTVSTKTIRSGKRISVVEVCILADEKEVAKATALKIKTNDLQIPDDMLLPECPYAAPDSLETLTMMGGSALGNQPKRPAGLNFLLEIKRIGGFDGKGSGTAWFRSPVPVVEGHALSPLAHLGTLSDFGNGLAQIFVPGTAGSINADISMYINRLPKGEWVCLDSSSVMTEFGIGRVTTTLYDEQGMIGSIVQMTLAQILA